MSSVEPAGDFDDLLQAYDMDLAQPLNDVVKASNEGDSEGRSHKSPPLPNDELSWEVMQVGASDPHNSPPIDFSDGSKNRTDSDDWVLQPDVDKKSMKDTTDLPTIQTMSSPTDTADPVPADHRESKESNEKPRNKYPDDISESEDEDSETLVIDTSYSAAESDSQNKEGASQPRVSPRVNGSETDSKMIENEGTKMADKEDVPETNTNSTEPKNRFESVSSESSNDSLPKTDGGYSSEKNTDSNDLGSGKDPSSNEKTVPIDDSPSPAPTKPCENTKIPEYGMIKNDNNETVIVIEPTSPNIEPANSDHINFIPGTIKIEPGVAKTTTAPPKVISAPPGMLSVSASLTTGTSLSSALQTKPSVLPAFMMNSTPQIAHPPRTLIRSPLTKPMPQVLFRHVGSGPRPSFVRLGSQALQQIARLTSPAGIPSVTPSQRMISVLMNPSANPASGTGLASSFPQIVTGKPPGTLVQGANTSSPLKVLFIPSQATTPVTFTPTISTRCSTSGGRTIRVVTPSNIKTRTTPTVVEMSSNRNGKMPSQGQRGADGNRQRLKSNGVANTKPSSTGSTGSEVGLNIAITEERFKRRILGKGNAVKSYHPTLSKNMSSVGFSFFSCPGCKDVFVNQSSLDMHRKRKSVRIAFKCEVCSNRYNFPNKCQFRCHILKHVSPVKPFGKTFLEGVKLRSLSHSDLNSNEVRLSKEEDRVTSGLDIPGLDIEMSIPEPKPESVKPRKVVVDPDSSLGFTISNVSSICSEENIPVGDISMNTKPPPPPPPPPVPSKNPAFVKGIAMEPTFLTNQSLTASSITPQPVMNMLYKPEPSKSTTLVFNLNKEKQWSERQATPGSTNPIPNQEKSIIASASKLVDPARPEVTNPPSSNMPGSKTSPDECVYCVICFQSFPDYMALQRHFNDSDKPHSLKAPCCGAKLASECAIQAHRRTHLTKQPYVCPDCGVHFRSSVQFFRKHRQWCTKIMESAMIVYPCRICTNWYLRIDELRIHIRENHCESYLKCILCPMAFKSKATFNEHNTVKHSVTKEVCLNTSLIYKCPLCECVFQDKHLKDEHLEHHMNTIYATQKVSFLCSLCRKLNASYHDLFNHMKEKHRDVYIGMGYICDSCGQDFQSAKECVDHMQKMYQSKPSNLRWIPNSMDELAVIMGEKAASDAPASTTPSENSQPTEPPTPKERKDSTASIETPTKDEPATPSDVTSNVSRDTHSPGNVSRTSSFYSEGASDETQGPKGRSMKCHICMNIFPNMKALIHHKKMDHGLMKTRRRKRKSDLIPPALPQKKMKDEDMKSPELQVKSDFMLRFQCDDCDYRTTSFMDLQAHRRAIHGLRAHFPCQLCGQTFESSQQVDEHQKNTHSGSIREYPFNCWICSEQNVRKGYTKRAYLVKHLISAHKIPSRTMDTERLNKMEEDAQLAMDVTKIEENPEPHTGTMTMSTDSFKCVRCDFCIDSREEFTKHINSHKLATDSFLCHECGMCFTVMTTLKNHLRLVHKIKKFDDYVEKYNIKLCSPPEATKAKRIIKERRPSGKKAGDPLECTVCYKKFTDEAGLKNHMRSHGMAFIRSKRLAPIAFIND